MGLGAIAAAAKHGKFELDKLATWKPGQAVPFAFLADTFEAIAEESKRLVITSLLVCSSLLLTITAQILSRVSRGSCDSGRSRVAASVSPASQILVDAKFSLFALNYSLL